MSNAILDAVELVLREEGYAAATSRRIAEAAGCKQQLIYYYFRTVDDLLLQAFKRRTSRAMERLSGELGADSAARVIWTDLNSTFDPVLSFEFMALANHHEGIRLEVARFVTESRRLQIAAMSCRDSGTDDDPAAIPLTPAVAAFLMSSISMLLRREAASGINEGHDDVRLFLDWMLERLA